MNELKKGVKMIRYAYGIKSTCIQAGFFFLSGLILTVTGDGGDFGSLGGFFWICIGLLPLQLLYSLSVSNMVLASPMRKKMQTVVPTAVNAASMVVIYLAEVLVCGLLERRNPQQAGELYLNLVVLAMSQVFLMVYSGLCYKHFVLATLLFIPVMVNWMWEGWGNRMHIWLQGLDMTFGRAVLTGFCLIAAGILAEYLLTLLFYRSPMAKMAQALPLRKAL